MSLATTPFAQYRPLGLQRTLILGGVGLVVIGALSLALYLTFFQVHYAVLFSNLKQSDASAIVADLDKKHLTYRLADGGSTILAPRDKVDAMRLDVVNEDLPIKGMVGFELFNKSDMGLTEFAQKINYQRALQGELARTIMSLDAIDNARVHLSLPDPTIFRDDKRAPKASAMLVTRAGRTLSIGTIAGVRRLIAAAVPDLDAANVVILDGQGNVVSGDMPTAVATRGGPDQHEQLAIEAYYQAQVERRLQGLFPNAAVTVAIPATLVEGASAASAVLPAVWEGWSPQDRRFGLVVTVNAGRALSDAEQVSARNLAQTALGASAGQADQIEFSNAPLTAEAALAAPLPSPGVQAGRPQSAGLEATGRPATGVGTASGFWVVVALILFVPLGLTAAWLAGFGQRRRRRLAGLSEDERGAYADRFKAILAEGGYDASPS